ncbi:MAG: DUF4240 domain-containing protein [Chitinophagaceae bacterium]|nr:MAG: DUF4240 domain-containing protein [Chitinophagaceae bacterium]
MTLEKFWEYLEEVWAAESELKKKRRKALDTDDEKLFQDLTIEIEEVLLESYEDMLYNLEKSELESFIHHLEERLFNIDRKDVHKYIEGSDDGFLYCRCFVVAMGEEYYNRVDKSPGAAHPDLEAEGFGFTAYSVYADRFDDEFERNSKHNIETGSNLSGWPAR